MNKTLWELEPGETGIVEKISCDRSQHRRLLDLGFVKESEILCVGKSPLGDPKAYQVRGAVIAIRKKEGKNILLKFKHEKIKTKQQNTDSNRNLKILC